MRRMMLTATACLLVLASLTLAPLTQPETALAANATVTTCDEAHFDAALADVQNSGGGTITFDCSGTINFSSQKEIISDVTIAGDGSVILDGNVSTRLFRVNHPAHLALTGLTLQNGNAGQDGNGGAILNSGGTLTIMDSVFSDNIAGNLGGAIRVIGGAMTVTGSTFSGNNAPSGGGAIHSDTGALTVTGSTFSGNFVNIRGGAIRNDGSGTLTITGSAFSANIANSAGGAIYNGGPAVSITASDFSGNVAISGGAINNFAGAMTVMASSFSGNSTTQFGGAINNDGGTLAVMASSFSGNSADSEGGAIRVIGGSATITASAFSDNTAAFGGAIQNRNSATVADSTFSGNSATIGGAINNVFSSTATIIASTFSGNIASGGGALSSSSNGMLTVKASTISGNTANAGGAIYTFLDATVSVQSTILASSSGANCAVSSGATLTSGGSNLSDDASCNLTATGDIPSSTGVNLGPLTGNGGPTMTMLPQSGSDAIDNAECALSTIRDQRGAPRPGTGCDIGAVEAGGSVPVKIFVTYNLGPVDQGDPVAIFVVAYGPASAPLTYEFDCDNDGVYEISQVDDPSADCALAPGSHVVPVRVSVGANSVTGQTTVVVLGSAASITSLGLAPSPSDEGGEVALTAGFTNTSPSATHTCQIDWGDGTAEAGSVTETNGEGVCAGSHSYADDGEYTVTVAVCDNNACDEVSASQMVHNVGPTITTLAVTPEVAQLGTSVDLNAAFTDPGVLDSHAASIDWGDGNQCDTELDSTCQVSTTNGSGTVQASHAYTAPGVYPVTLTVTDDVGGSHSASVKFVVVYEPAGGFVTGGGWIDSPASAYRADPSLTGKARFGFISKYQKGANVPTGNTQFQFKAGELGFRAENYQWLIVNQNGANAQFKGAGTINGELAPSGEQYQFMLWAGEGTPDTFRIRIWYESGGSEVEIYDNGVAQPLGGGSIVIHTGS